MSCENLAAEAAWIACELDGLVGPLMARCAAPDKLRPFLNALEVTPTAHMATAWVADSDLRKDLGVVFGLFIWALRLDFKWMAEEVAPGSIDLMAVAHESASLGLTRLSRRNGIGILQAQLDRVKGRAWAWTERFGLKAHQSPTQGAATELDSWIYHLGCYAATGALLSGRLECAGSVANAFEAYLRLVDQADDGTLLTRFAFDLRQDSDKMPSLYDQPNEMKMKCRSMLQETLSAFPVDKIFENRFQRHIGDQEL